MFKVVLNVGFICLNIDGIVVFGGCIFCFWMGLGDFVGDKRDFLKV